MDDSSMDAITGILVVLFLTTGIILNTLVILAVMKKSSHTFKDVLVISFTCCLLGEICFGIIWEGYGRYIDDSSLALCKMAGFGATFTTLVSIIHLIGMALERYISIIHPMTAYQYFKDHMLAMYFLIPSWVFGIAWACFPFFGWGAYMREPVHTYRCSVVASSNSNDAQSYNYSLLIFFFFLPIILIIYLCACVQIELAKTRKEAIETLTGDSAMIDSRKKHEKEHFVLVCFVIITYLVTWTPYAISACWFAFFKSQSNEMVGYSALFAKSALVTNPIIYVFFYKEFRETLKTKVFTRKASTSVDMPIRSSLSQKIDIHE
uniref:Opsin n=1 Tax=Cladonema radiatum TaxID=264074 RepID=A9CR38_9CNID|nr:opsin [Cladonema radiatum]